MLLLSIERALTARAKAITFKTVAIKAYNKLCRRLAPALLTVKPTAGSSPKHAGSNLSSPLNEFND
jgi:hypothetical protein